MRLTRLPVPTMFMFVVAVAGVVAVHARSSAAREADVAPREGPSETALFDPQRHMRVAEVKPGMTGFGLSVFSGTRIERFEVEVISVLRNFAPKHDVILIRCRGANLEHSGAIGGMSGSPIYLVDDHGRERMVGAFAYGWPLLKDPLAGVQPIEYMLKLPEHGDEPTVASPNSSGARIPKPAGADAGKRDGRGSTHWSILDRMPLAGRDAPAAFPTRGLGSLEPNPAFFAPFGGDARLRPLASPLMVGGVPGDVLGAYAPLLRAYGLSPLQAGGSSGGSPDVAEPKVSPTKLEPGAVLAVPMVTGDLDMTAIGTVTETVGGRVFGFGHPFNNEGPVSLPMGTGKVNGVLARLDQSQKIGSLLEVTGTLTTDQSVGVSGRVGRTPVTAPVELHVSYADGSLAETYRFECAIHPRFTPLLGGMAMAASLQAVRELPRHHTLEYDLKLEFANGQVIEVRDVAVDAGAAWPMQAIVMPLMAVTDNPFEPVAISRITGSLKVLPEARKAEILSVNVPRLKYKPGETLKAFITHRPFRGDEAVLPVELKLPHDLGDGTYQLVVSGWERYVSDETLAQPFRFTAENAHQMFAVLRDVMSIRHDAAYVRLLRQPDGVAVGRVAMPRLPSSMRQVLLGAGRSNTTPFVSSTVKIVPTEYVLEGEADFSIEIDVEERVEAGSNNAGAGGGANAPPKADGPETGEGRSPKPGPRDLPEQPGIERDPPGDDLPGEAPGH